jgi:uncharacterized protein (DUF608 family)
MKKGRINRREFIASSALVTAGSAQTKPKSEQSSAAQSFLSAAGSVIPFSKRELLAEGPIRTFTGQHLSEIAFPLGGIGTGTVSLGGRGDLRDWEIFNRPNKGKSLPFTFAALWARAASAKPTVRVIESAPLPPYRGSFGYSRERAQGLPHFRGARFTGTYPFARIEFQDPSLPVTVSLEAFNPLIPLEVDDSALPVAIMRYTVSNTTSREVEAGLAFSILNAIGYDGRSAIGNNRFAGFGGNVTRLRKESMQSGGAQGPRFLQGLELVSTKYQPGDVRFGSMALVTTHPDAGARVAWEEGPWWDSFQKWLDEFLAAGTFSGPAEMKPTADGFSNYATLASRFSLKPRQSQAVDLVLAWYFPTRENYWNNEPEVKGQKLRNYYGTRFADAWEVARYAAGELGRLEKSTRLFQQSFFSSTLPAAVLDAVSSQASIIRTNTCMLLEGKQFFAFEGTGDDSGCCPMNCTHVWNYAQALAHLFPELERSMRITDFKSNLRPDGSMAFRTLVPLGKTLWKFKPAADGQMGCVMKAYREWQMSGNSGFLRDLWPQIKLALEYAWKDWDADRDGVMEGEQHNTYDIEFYGPNTMMGTLYLGALQACALMADAMGDGDSAKKYRRIFESGRARLDKDLWRDGYYVQLVPEPSQIRPAKTEGAETWHAPAVDRGAVKYQYGEGCLSDQLLGQWFAQVVGLGYLLPQDHVRSALLSVYRNNFKHNFYDQPNTQRIYALNDDKGLLICSWPRGRRPALPFVYSDEVWTGIEYQVAAHLIYEGLVMEGVAIVKGARDRYDGLRRNPWNEVECGSHYARALSSWSLLTALSGCRYSGPEDRLEFAPRVNEADFRSVFSAGRGWGIYTQKQSAAVSSASIALLQGELELRKIAVPVITGSRSVRAKLNGKAMAAAVGSDGTLNLAEPARLKAGDVLTISR